MHKLQHQVERYATQKRSVQREQHFGSEESLLLSKTGSIKILDLGLARLPRSADGAGHTEGVSLTPVGSAMMGTADYMAPEQAIDFHQADIRSDIYSLGCTLYFLLTGKPPFAGGTLAQKVAKHLQVEPPALTEARPDAPAALAAEALTPFAGKVASSGRLGGAWWSKLRKLSARRRLLARTDSEGRAVGRKCQCFHACAELFGVMERSGLCLPEPQRLVMAAARQPPPIGREGERRDSPFVL